MQIAASPNTVPL